MSVDPLAKKFSNLTPYQFAHNTPIMGSDLDGAELQVDIYGHKYFGPVDPKTILNPLVEGGAPLLNAIKAAHKNEKATVAPTYPVPTYLTITYGSAKPLATNKPKEFTFKPDTRTQNEKDANEYAKWLAEQQKASPFMYGGGDFGMGFASTMGTTIKVAPGVILPQVGAELIIAELVAPIGFESVAAFNATTSEIKAATGLSNDALVGLRGSRVTGISYSSGNPINTATADYDFFIVSDDLYQQAISMGIKGKDGALSVGASQKFSNIVNIEKALTNRLGNKVTIRIFNKEGFKNAAKAAAAKVGK